MLSLTPLRVGEDGGGVGDGDGDGDGEPREEDGVGDGERLVYRGVPKGVRTRFGTRLYSLLSSAARALLRAGKGRLTGRGGGVPASVNGLHCRARRGTALAMVAATVMESGHAVLARPAMCSLVGIASCWKIFSMVAMGVRRSRGSGLLLLGAHRIGGGVTAGERCIIWFT
jgi:hypothetical protein